MRLNKYIAQSGYCSRRKADQLIQEGSVKINGQPASIGQTVQEDDTVTINGQEILITDQDIYYAFHKPFGAICTADPDADNTIYDYLPQNERLLYVGRLDVESSGLMLMTSNGDVAHAIAHSGKDHEKEYIVTVDKPITRSFIEQMKNGIVLEGKKTKPARLKKIRDDRFSLVLTEGKNRQIRNMCEILGYTVKILRRVRIMNISLGQLGEGNYRPLTKTERRELLALLGL